MLPEFKERLFKMLPSLIGDFGTPFHIYDMTGIIETSHRLLDAFRGVQNFQEYFAVKALPNPTILALLRKYAGFGFDCSSTMELELAEAVGAWGHDIMFTSNNTTHNDFHEAMERGALINLDDISLVAKVPDPFPETICFRYNPGPDRTGNSIIGNPVEAKYGITKEQLVPAYKAACDRGARHFGIHTMVCSNELNYKYMVETVRMLLDLCLTLNHELGIAVEFINMGGGIGIPYKPEDKPFELEKLGEEISTMLLTFHMVSGFLPKLLMESGRFITGPHGVLVSRVINRKDTYQTHVGVDAGMESLMRHAMYGAYHHMTVLNSKGKRVKDTERGYEIVNVVGAICENCDRLATQRQLPVTVEGDIIVTHDTGAHGIAMGFNYNGRLRPQELLLKSDGTVLRIRRAETNEDLWRTLREA
jgi:diaminopimelate decarboxylase